jgi:phosphoribosylamine--glycine ligase
MDKTKILVLGNGGREHVFIWKLSQSEQPVELFCAPGNAGTKELAKNVDLNISDFDSIGDFCLKEGINIVIPGSEAPLVAGIVDHFKATLALRNVYVFGPSKAAAELEGSKDFAKRFLVNNKIPTAAYQTFSAKELAEAKAFLTTLEAPYVLKADGLAAGKGVMITADRVEAEKLLEEILEGGKFGNAGNRVVIEEFLDGIEFSVFAMSDGKNYILLPEAKDYKRIGEGDVGLNTGGMGAVSPVNFVSDELMTKVKSEIIAPTFQGLEEAKMPFVGFLFFGLINVNGQPKVIEYNVRMGDPETEVVFPRWEFDLVKGLLASRDNNLINVKSTFKSQICTTVFAVSGGYPEGYAKGKQIDFNIDPKQTQDSIVFHAGTHVNDNGELVTSGGRVIAVSGLGTDIQSALQKSYKGIQNLNFEGMYYRKDIGFDLLQLEIEK